MICCSALQRGLMHTPDLVASAVPTGWTFPRESTNRAGHVSGRLSCGAGSSCSAHRLSGYVKSGHQFRSESDSTKSRLFHEHDTDLQTANFLLQSQGLY